jgi:hypothetical protein
VQEQCIPLAEPRASDRTAGGDQWEPRMGQPARPSWAGARVMKASQALTSGQKLVWLELWALDHGPERAFVSAARLAERLGMSVDNVEKARRQLRSLRLLASGPRPSGRGVTWWATLPADCLPSSRPSDAAIMELAGRLDARIEGQGTRRRTTPGGRELGQTGNEVAYWSTPFRAIRRAYASTPLPPISRAYSSTPVRPVSRAYWSTPVGRGG